MAFRDRPLNEIVSATLCAPFELLDKLDLSLLCGLVGLNDHSDGSAQPSLHDRMRRLDLQL